MDNNLLYVIGLLVFIIVFWSGYKIGFSKGRNYVSDLDSSDPRHWVSKKWGYEITFPGTWEPIQRNSSKVKGVGIDVVCGNRSGFSTAVFAYPWFPSDSIEVSLDEILKNYRKHYKNLEIVERAKIKNNSIFGEQVIFHTGEFTHVYVFLVSQKTKLGISSNALRKDFERARRDFDEILASVKFQDEVERD